MDEKAKSDFWSRRFSRREALKIGGQAAAVGAVAVFGRHILSGQSPEAGAYPMGEIVDGVETFGHSQPLNQSEFDSLRNEFNTNIKEMRQDTYYSSVFVTQSEYQQFLIDNQESVQSLVARHITALDQMLKNANPPTPGGFNLRRIIVVQDNVATPASHHSGYLTDGLKDSNGVWTFNHSERYILANSSYVDPQTRIDYGLLHEFGHAILHLNEQGVLNVGPTEVDPYFYNRLPVEWQSFFDDTGLPVSSQELMSNCGRSLRQYTALQLHRRFVGQFSHNFAQTLLDYLSWNTEFPPQVKMVIKMQGQIINPTSVQIFRTKGTGSGYDKKLEPTVIYNGSLDNLNPAVLFPINQGGIPRTDATLLILMTDAAGTQYFRWMDVRDFNIARWLLPNCNQVEMEIPVPAPGQTPQNFNRQINYKAIPVTPTVSPTASPTPGQSTPTPIPEGTVTPTASPTVKSSPTANPELSRKTYLPIVTNRK